MRPLLADDGPHPGRPGRQVEHPGDVRNPGPVSDLPVAVIGGRPGTGGDLEDRVLHVLGDGHADRVVQAAGLRGQPLQEPVRAATGVGPDEHLAPQPGGAAGPAPAGRPRYGQQPCSSRRSRSAARWPAAPRSRRRRGRRRRSWDENRPNVFFQVGAASSFSECAITIVASRSTVTRFPSAPGAASQASAHAAPAPPGSPPAPAARPPPGS